MTRRGFSEGPKSNISNGPGSIGKHGKEFSRSGGCCLEKANNELRLAGQRSQTKVKEPTCTSTASADEVRAGRAFICTRRVRHLASARTLRASSFQAAQSRSRRMHTLKRKRRKEQALQAKPPGARNPCQAQGQCLPKQAMRCSCSTSSVVEHRLKRTVLVLLMPRNAALERGRQERNH